MGSPAAGLPEFPPMRVCPTRRLKFGSLNPLFPAPRGTLTYNITSVDWGSGVGPLDGPAMAAAQGSTQIPHQNAVRNRMTATPYRSGNYSSRPRQGERSDTS